MTAIELLPKNRFGGRSITASTKLFSTRYFLIFFSDPLTAAPHDPDVKALLRIAQVYDIPMANNKATADFLIHSALMDEVYNHKIVNFNKNIADRASTLPGGQK